jgi:1,2-diacylglycerol 3-beta-galactosyltransferase
LIVTSDTGAGHRSVSNALIAQAASQPERGLSLIDVDPFVPPPAAGAGAARGAGRAPADRIVPLYGPVVRRAPWLWGWSFRLADNPLMLQVYLALFGGNLIERLSQAITRTGADAVVSVHPLVNHALARVRRRAGRPAMPLMTVVTDLVDVHSWWASRDVDQYTVGSDAAAGHLNALGVPPQRIASVGIPIRHDFGTIAASAREMRQRLGLDPDLPAVLLMGGGEGAGRLPETAHAFAALSKRGRRLQLVVVTGRNRRARIALEAQAWPVPVVVHGLIQNVAEYMTAADVVATKPGSLTVSEALAVGRPLLVGRPLPGQEEGNVDYVVRAGAGVAYRTAREAAEALAYLLENPADRWEMSQRAARLGRPHAAERTLDLLQALLLRAESAAPA